MMLKKRTVHRRSYSAGPPKGSSPVKNGNGHCKSNDDIQHKNVTSSMCDFLTDKYVMNDVNLELNWTWKLYLDFRSAAGFIRLLT